MSANDRDRDFDHLNVAEQILHVQDLWDRIARGGHDIGLTERQRVELERRLADHEQNPGKYTSWPELRQRLERRLSGPSN